MSASQALDASSILAFRTMCYNTAMKQVLIYSTPSCVYCKMAKEFFADNNIPFTEFNVAADPAKKAELVEKSGQLGVPVIQIGDDSIVIGFNKLKIKELLGI